MSKRILVPFGVRICVLSLILLTLLVALAFFHVQINRALAANLFLRSQTPREEAFLDLANGSANPTVFLKRCWATGKITHRQLVAALLKDQAAASPAWFPEVEPLVLAGTADVDMSVREMALATLEARRDTRLFDCALAQLRDVDPLIRELGLEYLRKADPKRGVPIAMGLLEDPDLRVVTRAEAALQRWTGQDFGVRVRLAIPQSDGLHATQLDPGSEEKIHDGIERRKEWWRSHSQEFPPVATVAGFAPPAASLAPPAADFSLKDLDGNSVRLADFQGKVVLLNFWATWCTACLAEIPDLAAVRQKFGDQAVVVGIALDGVPDEHHHESGADGEAEEQSVGKTFEEIRKKVTRAVKTRGINYQVLLDPTGSVGGRFNGGELPTTVILDAAGHVRRRFIGERNLQVFQSMIAEAARTGP